MQKATTLKRVKPEPSDGTPANKRLKPDELERVGLQALSLIHI